MKFFDIMREQILENIKNWRGNYTVTDIETVHKFIEPRPRYNFNKMEKEWQQVKRFVEARSERGSYISMDNSYLQYRNVLEMMQRLENCKSLTENGYGPTL